MTLNPGVRLGAYEITGALGAGGMGEVYEARDVRLGRDVAIKVLRASANASEEATARFRREARMLSQLSDPHICALFDIGEYEGRDYLVMELLDGETLASRLTRGRLPLNDVFRLGVEIATALHTAHRHGIVHRDLKPANIMLTAAGAKLLDFGLARPKAALLQESVETTAATMSSAGSLTRQGTILGTLEYIAPEQYEGRAVDERSDIFALGTVLYEMTTGSAAFAGTSAATIIAAIMHTEPPPVTMRQPAAPAALQRIIGTCIAKDPERRWQSSQDVALLLESARGGDHEPRAEAASAWRSPWLPWSVAVLAVALAAVMLFRPAGVSRLVGMPIGFAVAPPEGAAFLESVETVSLTLSPDGSVLAFIAYGPSTPLRVWLRPLAALDARPLNGTEGARSVFWSPDGRELGFFAGGKLKRIQVAGGGPLTICDVPPDIGHSGTWGSDGQILFASVQGDAIYRTSAGGDPPQAIVKRDPGAGIVRTVWPSFLPDGRRFVYLKRLPDGTLRLMLAEPGAAVREIMAVGSQAQYVDPGYLVFARDSTILAQRFDAASGQVSGDAFPVADGVNYFVSTGSAQFAVSRTGVLAYQSHLDQHRIAWVNPAGKEEAVVEPSDNYQYLRLSPDGREVMFDRVQARTGGRNLWIRDLERGVDTMVTSDPGSEIPGVWLPGSTSIVYSADRGGPPHMFRRDLTTGTEDQLMPPPAFSQASDVSPDGKWLVYDRRERGSFNIGLLPLAPKGQAAPTPIETPFNDRGARLSPNGRYAAFTSNEAGSSEVYVAPFPALRPRIPISAGGGEAARWSHDGSRLFYLTEAGLMLVAIQTSPSLSIGKPVTVVPMRPGALWIDYDVASDGRFLAVIPEVFGNRQPLTVLVNWASQAQR